MDIQRQACGFQDEETVEVECEKGPTGSLLHMCKVLLKPSQPLAKGLLLTLVGGEQKTQQNAQSMCFQVKGQH